MMRFIVILLFLSQTVFSTAQITYGTVPKPEGFLADILGASYNKKIKQWILPNTSPAFAAAQDLKDDGVQVQVDSMVMRQVDDELESWVLFSVEKYVYGFARLQVKDGGWSPQKIYYKLHEGAPGEYSRLNFMLQTLGPKTCIGIQELWYTSGVTDEKWLLFDPFSGENIGSFDMSSFGEKEQKPAAYTEFETNDIEFHPVKNGLPDVILVQKGIQKLKDKPEAPFSRKLKFRYDPKKKTYVRT